MKIYIGADHRGFELKEKVVEYLRLQESVVEDCGAQQYDKDDDYSDYAVVVGQKISEDVDARGILICGSGVGVSIAANRIGAVRAGLALSQKQVHDATMHDHLNVLCLSSDYMVLEDVYAALDAFVSTPYSMEERHVRRVKKMTP